MAEYIDRNLIEWYGCNYENAACENRECSGCHLAKCSQSQVMEIPTANVIEIPKGATNGDMIKAMFPNYESRYDADYEIITGHLDKTHRHNFDLDWWNAPYLLNIKP